jgi:hypothetical protein
MAEQERWLQHYRCGCFLGFRTKKLVPKHCPVHLRDRNGPPLRAQNEKDATP